MRLQIREQMQRVMMGNRMGPKWYQVCNGGEVGTVRMGLVLHTNVPVSLVWSVYYLVLPLTQGRFQQGAPGFPTFFL